MLYSFKKPIRAAYFGPLPTVKRTRFDHNYIGHDEPDQSDEKYVCKPHVQRLPVKEPKDARAPDRSSHRLAEINS